jgi:aryl-alcohol dehydrogenase-like predicted oxidoreductase
LEKFWELCKEIGEKEDVVAFAWVLSHSAVTSPIIGPRTIEQLQDLLRVPEVTLSEDTLKKLDEIFPGPVKPAPEAYAWYTVKHYQPKTAANPQNWPPS